MFLIYILLLAGQITSNNGNYLYIDENKKQSEAKSDCETKGGELLTYLDETNVDAVYDAAEDANNQEVWVGLKVDDDGKYQVIIEFLFLFYIRFFLISQDIFSR